MSVSFNEDISGWNPLCQGISWLLGFTVFWHFDSLSFVNQLFNWITEIRRLCHDNLSPKEQTYALVNSWIQNECVAGLRWGSRKACSKVRVINQPSLQEPAQGISSIEMNKFQVTRLFNYPYDEIFNHYVSRKLRSIHLTETVRLRLSGCNEKNLTVMVVQNGFLILKVVHMYLQTQSIVTKENLKHI